MIRTGIRAMEARKTNREEQQDEKSNPTAGAVLN